MSRLFSAVVIISFLLLELTLLVRAVQGRLLREFPLFYSFAAYMLLSWIPVTGMYLCASPYYARAFWFRFLLSTLVEFAVLVEISDHIFEPYPAIRRLGRFLTLGICTTFFLVYVLPSFWEPRSASLMMLDFVKRTSLTKAVTILTLLTAAYYYRLPLGKNISGVALGFSAYLGISIINFASAEKYGPALYARTLSIVWPLSYALALLIWTITLWRYEPVITRSHALSERGEEISGPLSGRLGRFNTMLMRLLRR